MKLAHVPWRKFWLLGGCATVAAASAQASVPPASGACQRTIRANVVALEQAIVLNRYGAFNPAGMLYALQRDVVFSGHRTIADGTPVTDENLAEAPGYVKLRKDKRPRPLVLRANEGDCLEVRFHNLLMRSAPDELSGSPEQYQVPRPGWPATAPKRYDGRVPAHAEDPPEVVYNTPENRASGRNLVRADSVSNDRPWTRAASFHVNGLELAPIPRGDCPLSTAQRVWLCNTDGDNAGMNRAVIRADASLSAAQQEALAQQAGQVLPGQSALYRVRAFREGTYFAYSTAASVGGEGDGGQLGAGLFAAVNVQPRLSKWYRSQVTHSDLEAARRAPAAGTRHRYGNLDYDGARYASGPQRGTPILAMLDGNEIVHSDLNAIVVLTDDPGDPDPDHQDTTGKDRPCSGYVHGNSCGKAFREFTVVMHDEVKAVQAFAELEDPGNPLHAIKDGMGINYGVGGMGAMVVARNRRTGPTRDCPECRAEEFFLSSWANGDPALVLKWDDKGEKPIGALYPDDPSNVHHSYLNDPVRFRNLHAGPKETHVFHLHAHQWVQDTSAPGSTYLDSQTISPGATFSYEIEFGGSGNKNLSPGDSIFHCHLYPHFAQGMWELWRVHDVFEDGSSGRQLPDAEVAGGTENPAVVPLPGSALALMPTEDFKGYPFYVAGEPGHRPPQPPMDMDLDSNGKAVDGGLPRHIITGWEGAGNHTMRSLANQEVLENALKKGANHYNSRITEINARRVYAQNPNALNALAEEWKELGGMKLLDPEGEPQERKAMEFHEGALASAGFSPVTASGSPQGLAWEQTAKGYASEWASTVGGQPAVPPASAIFFVNGRPRTRGAPFADPCPVEHRMPLREYRAGVIQTELTVNKHGWFDPQARILALEQDIANVIDPNTRDRLPEPLFFRANSGDCINFKHSNFVPNALALDDFQIYTPTDTIGQHIHLVKFDVTSSDGSGNGWNYEDGTFSPEEVRERVHAYNVAAAKSGKAPLALKTHPLFAQPCKAGDANCERLQERGVCPPNAAALPLHELAEKHPFCGAQRTVQRWYADPIFDPKNGKDYTLRTVFSHDHFGPSSHQQHGLYAALVIEPSNSVWLNIGENQLDWNKLCSGDANEMEKVLGGASLNDRAYARDVCSAYSAKVGVKELRAPLKLRDDGGPTSTRANIFAPKCLYDASVKNGGARKNSNPLDPKADLACPKDAQGNELLTNDTRREYGIAFADFSILYNTALEPINPETRDLSALRFGRRQVPINRPAPLAISSEDPGTQLINYRNEPIPLRVTEFPPKVDEELGGFRYSYPSVACEPGDPACTSDMANVFSTGAHARRDSLLATRNSYPLSFSPAGRALLKGKGMEQQLDMALGRIEGWRHDFNCGISRDPRIGGCRIADKRRDALRELGDPATPIIAAYEDDPLYIRLIQGAQEAQHVFAMTGQKWLREADNPNSGFVNAQPLGISEHFEMSVKPNPLGVARLDSLYLGSSVDQLWDGMWGLVRTYGYDGTQGTGPDGEEQTTYTPHTEPGLARLLASAPLPAAGNRASQACAAVPVKDRLHFDISAVRACDLSGTCGATVRGIPYNRRIGMDDPNGIVFVRNNHRPGESEPAGMNLKDNAAVMSDLRADIQNGVRRIEPLILRAAAGQCIQVQLRNHLPQDMREGPHGATANSLASHSDNFMSMITDGFNYNQLRMSTSVGLSAPKLVGAGLVADGANFGANQLTFDGRQPGTGFLKPAAQGNLVPACAPGAARCASRVMTWYAGHYQLDGKGGQVAAPVELGAVPLSSFGDVVKHPAHGAIGALVIGPANSRTCQSAHRKEQKADRNTYASATICDAQGTPLYRDFVLVLQDAVDAKIKGDLVPNLKGAEEPDDYGIKAVNYRSEPLWARRGGDPSVPFEERNEFDYAGVLSSKELSRGGRCQADIPFLQPEGDWLGRCDPETPVFLAKAGAQVRLRVVHPGGHTRQQAIALSGHDWNPHPFQEKSTRIAATHEAATRNAWTLQGAYNGVGPLMGADLVIQAGGRSQVAGDYLWRSQASFLHDGGIWGLIRVEP